MFTNRMPRFEPLSDEALATIDRGVDRLAAEVGVQFDHPDAIERFRAAGQTIVDQTVHFDPGFLRAQARQVRPGGVVVASDHATDPDPIAARWHHEIECARDRTHSRNLTSGELVDALGRAGLARLQLVEEELELDFDEWFDRGTPALPKAEVRARLLAGRARGFDPVLRGDGGITIHCVRALVRGVKPGSD